MSVELPEEMPQRDSAPLPEMTQAMYSVFVQMEYRVPAVDGADALQQISHDLGVGRSYKSALEVTMSLSTRPIPNGPHT